MEQTATLKDLTTFLLAHLDWASEQPWVDDYATEIEDLTRTAHGLAPSRPQNYRLPAPCPSCGASELHRRDGDDFVSCLSCLSCGRPCRRRTTGLPDTPNGG